ncbi:MAG: MFS transporter [Peptococcaceae bacterium]|nr:MFS transporter [Peptococcaceae bacterium]
MSTVFSKNQKQAIVGMSLALGLRVFGVSLFLPVFTLFGQQFTQNGTEIGFALGVYGLVQAIFQVPLGALSDRFGRKRVILFGLFIYAVGSLIAAEATNIYILIFARALQGGGAISGAVYAFMADAIEPEKRGRAMGLLGMPMGIAFSVGIVLGPMIASISSVRALFVFCAILVAFAFIYIVVALKEPGHQPHAELQLAPAEILLVLRDRRILWVTVGGFIANFFQVGIFAILPVLTTRYKGMANFWELIVPMVVVGTSIMMWGARQADSGRAKSMTTLAFAFLGLSALAFFIPGYSLFKNGDSDFLMLIVSGVLFFAGFSMTQPLLSAGVTKLAQSTRVGATSGVYNMAQNLGTFFGGFLGGAFLTHNMGLFLILMGILGFWGAGVVGRALA